MAGVSPIPATLAAAGLVHVSDEVPGIRRVRHGRGFRYFDPGGRPLADRTALERIARLAIPPAYDDVWICAEPRGHLQATGRDARGRKQYRYHAAWRQLRDGEKFQRMPDFADALPRLRRRLRSDLALPGLPRDKVLAVVVRLLDTTHARVGNQEYVRQNGSFGLATLHSRHVHFVRGGSLELRAIDSGQVNAYLREAMGEGFTAKDFRTWAATLRALALMHATPLPERPTERALARAIAEAIRVVAAELRNTPAVCRKSYVNPLVFDAWRSGELHRGFRDVALVPPRAAAFLRRAARRTGRIPRAARSPERRAKKGRMPRHPPK